jgi:hypothetical protein
MSYKFKKVQAEVAYRVANISFTEDGGISASVTIGTLTKQKDSDESVFSQIAQQGYYLGKDEVDQLNIEKVSGNIRDVVEAAIEAKLREKGSLII